MAKKKKQPHLYTEHQALVFNLFTRERGGVVVFLLFHGAAGEKGVDKMVMLP